jgi:hypothetical protein
MSDLTAEESEVAHDIPEHLRRWPGLFVREGDRIIEAPAEDQSIARSYPAWPDKGAVTAGMRITIMTKKKTYHIEEAVRVIHVFEATEPGHEVYVMGPKPIFGEYVDDLQATEPPPDVEDPWIPTMYDGATLPSPAVDYNYEITSYTFAEPGIHRICWRLGPLQSNVLEVEVIDSQ